MSIGQKTYHLFWKISGEDPQILIGTKSQIKVRFLFSGILVFTLFWISVYSYQYSFNKLFRIPNWSWIVGFLFSMMVINIYRLNIITLAPKKLHYTFGYFISLIIRILFIILIGLTIIKPLEKVIFNKIVTKEVTSFKEKEIKNTVKKAELYYDELIKKLDNQIQTLEKQIAENRIINDQTKVIYLSNQLDFLKNDKKYQIAEIKRLLNKSPYFLKGIILLNQKHPKIWLMTIILMILFLTPFILKFTTSPSGFYRRRQILLHEKIVKNEYDNFKLLYQQIFFKVIGKQIVMVENYQDPPFNTIKKVDARKIGVEQDFIYHLYGDKES